MITKNTFIKFASIGAAVVLGIVALGVQRAYADNLPWISVGTSYSGNTVTVSGNYFAGDTKYQTSCGGIGIGVILPEGALFGTVSYVTDDGKTGNSTAHTVTIPETYATCSANGGQGEDGTFSFTFTDDTSVTHTGTLNFGVNVPVNVPIAGSSWSGSVTVPFSYGAPSGGGGGGGGGNNGTINVTSKNANTGAGVVASWNFGTTGIINPCSVGNCTNVSAATYDGLPIDTTYALSPVPNSAGSQYSFGGIEEAPIATNRDNGHGIFGSLLALSRNLGVPVADAFSFDSCGPSQTITVGAGCGSAPALAANFTILWNPIGSILGSPATVALTAASPSATEAVSNNGASGSTVDSLSDAIDYGSGPSGWLSVSSLSGITLSQGGSPTNITLTASPVGGCSSGCAATIYVNGTSNKSVVSANPITVNFTSGAPAPPVSIITVNPSPNEPVTTPITATCSGGSGSYTWSATGPVIASSYTGSTFTFSYSAPGTYTLTCTDASDSSNSASVPVTITQITPSCAFAANPNQIVLPGNSVLSWTCANAVSCTINGTSVSPTAGTLNVTPTTNTTYVLQCQGPGVGAGSTSSVQTQVRVVGPGIIEGNP